MDSSISMFLAREFGGLAAMVPVATMLLAFALRVVVGLAVWRDAGALRRDGDGPVLIGRFWWALAGFLGGIFVGGLYWLVHHSTLRGYPLEKRPGGVPADLN